MHLLLCTRVPFDRQTMKLFVSLLNSFSDTFYIHITAMKTLIFRKRKDIFVFMLLLISLFSCKDNKKSLDLLSQAQGIMYLKPDSALILLDSIKSPESLSKNNYMQYVVANVQAKYKNYKDITSDTLIFVARDYFKKKDDDPKQIALATFYSGAYFYEKGSVRDAMAEYLKAAKYAEESNDLHLNGLIQSSIGYLYLKEYVYDSAVVRYERALEYYNKIPNSDSVIVRTLCSLYTTCTVAKRYESADMYYTRGLAIAKQMKSKYYEYMLDWHIGLALAQREEYDKSRYYLRRALASSSNAQDSLKLRLSLSRLYLDVDQLDSARYFAEPLKDKVSQLSDISTKMRIYSVLSRLEAKQGNYKGAYDYLVLDQKMYEALKEKQQSLGLREIEKKYDLSEKEKKMLELQMREYIIGLVALLAILLLIIAVLAIRVIRNKHRLEKRNNAFLNKQMKNMMYLNSIYKNIAEESAAFEKEIEALSITYGIKEKSKGYEQIRTSLKNMKKETEQRLSELTFDYMETQSVHPKILSTLNSADLLFLSLSYCGYETKDISIIMGVKPHALQMRKSRLIKKLQEINISDTRISSFLE